MKNIFTYIGTGLCIIGVYIAYAGLGLGTAIENPNSLRPDGDYSHVILLPIGIAIIAIGSLITRKSMAYSQRKIDDFAKNAIKKENFYGNSIFLRSFEMDGKYLVDKDQYSLEIQDYINFGKFSLERNISEAVRITSPMIGLGGRGGIDFGFGSGAFVEGDWKLKIETAINQSDYIFVIPAPTAGVLWEIEKIIDLEMLWKTMFIMPRNIDPIKMDHPEKVEKTWIETQKFLRDQLDFFLPDYSGEGAILKYDVYRSTIVMHHMSDEFFESPNHVVEAINELFGN